MAAEERLLSMEGLASPVGSWTRGRTWVGYGLAVALVVLTFLVRFQLGATGQRPLLILFTIPVLLSAYVGGAGPGLLATALAAGGMCYLAPINWVQLSTLCIVGTLISLVTQAMHRAVRRACVAERRGNEQKLQAIFHNAALGIVEVADNDTIIDVNRRLCEMLGYPREELLGKRIHI